MLIATLLLLLPSFRGDEGGSGLQMNQVALGTFVRRIVRTHDGHTHVDGEKALEGLTRRLVIMAVAWSIVYLSVHTALKVSRST